MSYLTKILNKATNLQNNLKQINVNDEKINSFCKDRVSIRNKEQKILLTMKSYSSEAMNQSKQKNSRETERSDEINELKEKIKGVQIQDLSQYIYLNLQKNLILQKRNKYFRKSKAEEFRNIGVYKQQTQSQNKAQILQQQNDKDKKEQISAQQRCEVQNKVRKNNNERSSKKYDIFQLIQMFLGLKNFDDVVRIKFTVDILKCVMEIRSDFQYHHKDLNNLSLPSNSQNMYDTKQTKKREFFSNYYKHLGNESPYLLSKIVEINQLLEYIDLDCGPKALKRQFKGLKLTNRAKSFKLSKKLKFFNEEELRKTNSEKKMQKQGEQILRFDPESFLLDSVGCFRFQNFQNYQWTHEQQLSSGNLV